ncbi:hypothetical protein BCT11_22475 [Vibrio sp. 10N.222.52.B12]|nr:hypothetical protein BCT11_22475 [Vibrio sp. 10N.222.52.B12]
MTNAKVPYNLLIQILFLTPKLRGNIKNLFINDLKASRKRQFEVDRRVTARYEEKLKERS